MLRNVYFIHKIEKWLNILLKTLYAKHCKILTISSMLCMNGLDKNIIP